jgi:catechol 2,3-dioxygenase-like lactoylglutathione lyase family enzyme
VVPNGTVGTVIGRLHHVVIDCPDPTALAQFYSELLGLPVTYRSDDWIVVSKDDTTSGIALQLAPDHQAPRWPDPQWPQQVHIDVMVEDLAEAARKVLQLGAERPSGGDHVFADPAGHPFCLVRRPTWAPPIAE